MSDGDQIINVTATRAEWQEMLESGCGTPAYSKVEGALKGGEPAGIELSTAARADKDHLMLRLRAAGIDQAVAEYSGSGDEGWVNDIAPYRDGQIVEGRLLSGLEDDLRDFAYKVIDEAGLGGWENNGGAEGTVTFDAEAGTVTISHGWIPEEPLQYEDYVG